MYHELTLLKEFHTKFKVLQSQTPTTISDKECKLRHGIILEELDEYLEANTKGDIAHIAKELGDVLYTVYGAILSHGLSEKMPEIFEEIHRSNMSKQLGQGYKPVKGKEYFKADVKMFL